MKRCPWISFAFLLLFSFCISQASNFDDEPLIPEERGTSGILAALERLPVYVRVLQITAHPDDESAGTLTWLSRKYHAQTALFSLTRGEGGQNILGSEKYEALGLVRTGELLEACRRYGTELYFGSELDFGFSKTAEETFAKWGHETTLEEMVRFIRRWRPTIILSRFQGSPEDGHGHHQAAGILVKEAFQAASDPKSFAQHLNQGLQPWRPGKLYVSSFGGTPGEEKAPVCIPVGDYDPVFGRSYREIGAEGYSKHRSQGNGTTYAPPGRSCEYFKLIDSSPGAAEKENSLFDNVDTSLAAIFYLAENERTAIPFLQSDLADAMQAALKALGAFRPSAPESSAAEVAHGIDILTEAIRKIELASLSAPKKELILDALRSKRTDFQKALNAVLGIHFIARSANATGVPGDKESVTATFYNRGTEPVTLQDIKLKAQGIPMPAKDNVPPGELSPGRSVSFEYSVELPREAPPTESFWRLENNRAARYQIRPTEDAFAPFGKPEILAEATYRYRNTAATIQSVARAQAGNPIRGAEFIDFQIVPALSVTIEPDIVIAGSPSASRPCQFRISVRNNQKLEAQGTLKLVSALGWKIQPEEMEFKLSRKDETFTASFIVQVPDAIPDGHYAIDAVAAMAGQEFRRGYQVISYPGNWTRHFYRKSQSRIEKFDIKVAPNLAVGYIPGAGDDIPKALEEIGVKVQTLVAEDLAFGNLNRFQTIITGIRAYNVNEDLRANNPRLLDFVAKGGTLIVQYVRPTGMPSRGNAGSPFSFGPYPMSVSDSHRITVEDSPVRILDPMHPLFNTPNKISEADFQGWVQERGLYFMSTWDPRYKALLSGNDPGEEPKDGGILYSGYGKGHYIYTGYAWFRQLPAGVPGAFRLFANMISLR